MRMCTMCGKVKEDTEYKLYRHTVNNKVYISTDSYCKNCRRLHDRDQHRIQRARKKGMEEMWK